MHLSDRQTSICPACGSENEILREMEYQGKEYPLIKCKSCKLAYIETPFSAEEIYQNDYFKEYDTYVEHTLIGGEGEERFIHYLKDINSKGYYSGKILEIGCAYGYLLKVFEKEGWITYGLDVSSHAIKVAKENTDAKLLVLNVEDENIPSPNNFFDVIIMIDVLEHIKKTGKVIKEIHRTLKPGGLLYMKTFNYDGLGRRVQQDKWSIIAPPQHCTFYSVNSIKTHLKNSGFSKIDIITNGFTLRLSNDELRDREKKNKLKKSALFRLIFKLASFPLKLFNLGDYMTVFARK